MIPSPIADFRLKPVLNDSQQGDVLISGLDMITDLVARHRIIIAQYLKLSPPSRDLDVELSEGFRRVLIKLYAKVFEYQAKAACYLSRGTLARFLRNVPKVDNWTELHQEILQIDNECKEYRLLFDSVSLDKKLHTVIEGMQKQENKLLERYVEQEKKEKAACRVLQLISNVSVEQDHDDVRNRLGSHYSGSGQWLLDSQKYLEWCNGPPSVLWLRGTVGVGKSSLTSIVIQQCLANAVDERVAFFYVSQQHGEAVDVFRSLLAQMSSEMNGSLAKPMRTWIELHFGYSAVCTGELPSPDVPSPTRKPSLGECVELLIELAKLTGKVTWVVDALDECHNPHELMECLNVTQRDASNVKIFLSSRRDIDVPRTHNFADLKLVEDFDSSLDMETFIKHEVDLPSRRDRSGMTAVQASQLCSLLLSRAEGMYVP